MTSRRITAAILASVSALALVAEPIAAAAQPDQGPPDQGGYDQNQAPPPPPPSQDEGGPPQGQYPPPQQGQYPPEQGQYPPQQGDYAPPQGQYAPPPPGEEAPGSTYDYNAQAADRDYAARYSAWAAQYCVNEHNNNVAAGAVIGGVLGAFLGAGVAGRGNRGGGAIVGGALGATAGAAVGSSAAPSGNCPPGYVVRAGAPGFYYGAPGYDAAVVVGPGWYNPWFFVGGQWVYRPYRYWYWNHQAYWRPGWRGGPYRYRRY